MIGAFIKWSNAQNGCAGYIIDGNGCHVWVGKRLQRRRKLANTRKLNGA